MLESVFLGYMSPSRMTVGCWALGLGQLPGADPRPSKWVEKQKQVDRGKDCLGGAEEVVLLVSLGLSFRELPAAGSLSPLGSEKQDTCGGSSLGPPIRQGLRLTSARLKPPRVPAQDLVLPTPTDPTDTSKCSVAWFPVWSPLLSVMTRVHVPSPASPG